MYQCIYCRRKSKNPFPKEHIMPSSFGKFNRNIVRTDIVCGDCNHKFGNELESFLAGDSFEGLARTNHGIKPSRVLKKNIRIKISIPDDFPIENLRGVFIKYDPVTKIIRHLPQIQVFDELKKKYRTILEEDLTKNIKNNPILDFSKMQITATTKKDCLRLERKLNKWGIKCKFNYRQIDKKSIPKKINFNVRGVIDSTITRTAAKIIFNYLAHIKGPNYVLSKDFDRIRDFILNNRNDKGLVSVSTKPILYIETENIKSFFGHILVVENAGYGIIGKVSLFNFFTYSILLTPYYSGLWTPLKSGHAFDPISKKIMPLTAISKSRLWLPK